MAAIGTIGGVIAGIAFLPEIAIGAAIGFGIFAAYLYFSSNGDVDEGHSNPADGTDVEITISGDRWKEASDHWEEAQNAGHSDKLTLDRSGASDRRKAALNGKKKVKGKDLDEYPPAIFNEGGKGASVKPISPGDNRGIGSYLGNKLRSYPDGTRVKIKILKKFISAE